MFSAINTKLLVIVLGLLASIASYFAYEKHKEQLIEKKAQEMRRQMRPDEKRAMPSGWGDDLKKK